eukprot:scaffold29623_cov46-Attheya_sp.AAC.3
MANYGKLWRGAALVLRHGLLRSTAHAFSASNQKHQTQQLLGTMMTPTQSPGAGYRDDEGITMGDEEQQDLISPPRPVGGPRQRRNLNEQQGSLGGNQYSDGEYSHVSSYVPRQPLESKTYGGYGPVHNNEDNLPSDWTYICGDVDDKGDEQYYRDDFNDQSWSCTFGTGEENGIWMNTRDQAGTIMAFMVWLFGLDDYVFGPDSVYGIGMPRQDDIFRSWIRPPERSTHGIATTITTKFVHVQPMSNL